MRAKPQTIDEYLAGVSPDKREALEQLRRTIRKVLPRAEECISYQMPGFKVDGRVIVWMGAGANHCAFYPGGIVEAMKSELAGYETSKGTVRFQPDRRLPLALVRRLIAGRMARDAEKRGSAAGDRRKRASSERKATATPRGRAKPKTARAGRNAGK